jgi:hypothetical protein
MTQYTKMTNKMQLCRIIYNSLAALHVLSDIFAQHQEHLNCSTASGITHVSLLAGTMGVLERNSNTPMISAGSSNTPMIPASSDYVCNTRSCNTV